MKKVCHLTSVHQRYDVRIFLKECSSLAENGFDVTLIVADSRENEVKNNVKIINVSTIKSKNRIVRMSKTVWQVYKKAKELKSDIYHIHDPELLSIALLLKNKSNKVVFDAHEDLPKQILDKFYINKYLRKSLSKFVQIFEYQVCKSLSGIVAATPSITNKFKKINSNAININNYPLLSELVEVSDWTLKKNEICFIGGISKIRGTSQVVEAMQYTSGTKLNIAGDYSPEEYRTELINIKGWDKVNEYGFVSRQAAREIMVNSKVGIVTFLPAANHIEAQPNKMFEYMSAGLPIVTSNFPLWKEIVEKNNCGICVDPLNSKEIAKAINYLLEDNKEAEVKGINGREVVMEKYNWKIESKKLTDFYNNILFKREN
jgi:glycosyltransferase involved in cell wall biosynthesis